MLADLPIDPNVIIVFGAVIFAAIKAFLERKQQKEAPLEEEYEEPFEDLYQEYEAELNRHREQAGLGIPEKKETPPPLPASTATPAPTPSINPAFAPKKPKLSAAEKAALENFQRQTTPSRRPASSTKTRVMKQLASPTAAREALLLAEILGPPKAMRPDENT